MLVRDLRTHRAFRKHVVRERAIFAHQLDTQQTVTFSRIKVEGVLESSLSVVVTYDADQGPGHHQRKMPCAWFNRWSPDSAGRDHPGEWAGKRK